MAIRFLPQRLDVAFSRMAFPEHLKALIALQGGPEHVAYWDDFVGSPTGTWPSNANWMYPATVGTGTEVIGITAGLGGTLTCTTGGTSGNGAYQHVGLNWRGTEGIYYACRFKVDSAATVKFELGLTDSITNEGAINAKASPTFTATDAAVFCFDTVDDTNLTFMTVNAGAAGANTDMGTTPTLTSYNIAEIRVQGGFASGYINGQYVGGGALTTTAPLTPYVGCTTRTGSTRTLTVDWQACVGPRFAV